MLEHPVSLKTRTQWNANPLGLLHWCLRLCVVGLEGASRELGIRLEHGCACRSQHWLWPDSLGNPMSRFPRVGTDIALGCDCASRLWLPDFDCSLCNNHLRLENLPQWASR